MSSTNVFSSELVGFDRELAFIDWCELPGLIKSELRNLITWGEFNLMDHEPMALFNMLERFAIFNVLTYVTKAGMGPSSIMELEIQLKDIFNYLIEYDYGAEELTRPSTLYMNCIGNIVRQKKGVLQATAHNGSLPNYMRFHIDYYRKLHLPLEVGKFFYSDLPWEVIEDLYLLKDLVDVEKGKVEPTEHLYETLVRGVVFDVVNRLRWKGADTLVEVIEQRYAEVRRHLIDIQYGYDLLYEEKPDFFEKAMQSVTGNLPRPFDFDEMAARLRRLMKFHQKYYEDLFAHAK